MVVLGQYNSVLLSIKLYWVSKVLVCLYILEKVEIWSGVTDASQTHRQQKIGLLSFSTVSSLSWVTQQVDLKLEHMIGRSHREPMNLETQRQFVEWSYTSSVLASSKLILIAVSPAPKSICKNQHTYKWTWPQMSSWWNCRIISVEFCPCRLFRLLQSCPSISLLRSFVVLTLALVMENGVGLKNPQNKSRFWTWRVVLHTTHLAS